MTFGALLRKATAPPTRQGEPAGAQPSTGRHRGARPASEPLRTAERCTGTASACLEEASGTEQPQHRHTDRTGPAPLCPAADGAVPRPGSTGSAGHWPARNPQLPGGGSASPSPEGLGERVPSRTPQTARAPQLRGEPDPPGAACPGATERPGTARPRCSPRRPPLGAGSTARRARSSAAARSRSGAAADPRCQRRQQQRGRSPPPAPAPWRGGAGRAARAGSGCCAAGERGDGRGDGRWGGRCGGAGGGAALRRRRCSPRPVSAAPAPQCPGRPRLCPPAAPPAAAGAAGLPLLPRCGTALTALSSARASPQVVQSRNGSDWKGP